MHDTTLSLTSLLQQLNIDLFVELNSFYQWLKYFKKIKCSQEYFQDV